MEKIGKRIKEQKTPRPTKRGGFFVNKKITKETMIQGFTKVPNVIIQDPALTCQDLRVLEVLMFHAFGKNWCNPSHRTIAREANISIAGAKRGTKKAKKLGYIDWERTGLSNKYILIWKVKDPKSSS